MDTLQEHDARCNELFRKLEALKASGQGGTIAGPEYLQTLKELRTATRARLNAAGMITPSLEVRNA